MLCVYQYTWLLVHIIVGGEADTKIQVSLSFSGRYLKENRTCYRAIQMPPAYLRGHRAPWTNQSRVNRLYSMCYYAQRMADIANYLLAWKCVKGVNMDLCREAATPSKHHTLMPVVEFNKLERWKLMKGKHKKGVGGVGEEVWKEGMSGWVREGASEQGRNTDGVRCCLVWSNQAKGYNSSQ